MNPEFVKNDLFRPFRSTKSQGYGIGAFECREYIRDMGGILEVESKLGAGTTVRITLPTVSVSHPTELAEMSMLAQ